MDLKNLPFRARGTPTTFVTYSSQKAASKFLDKTRNNKRGMGLFHGPPRSGKTSIIWNYATSTIPADHPVAIVDGNGMDETALLQAILDQFGYDVNFNSANERFNMVRVFVTQQASSGSAPFLVVENLDALEPSGQVALCELAALEVSGKCAIRMVLTSIQPMMPIVRKPTMKPILNRLTGEFQLKPLELKETRKYLRKKLIGAGCRNPEHVIPTDVCDRLHMESGGLPGVIDRLAAAAFSKCGKPPLKIDDVPRKGNPESPIDNIPVLSEEPQADVEPEIDSSLPHLIVTFEGKTVNKAEINKERFMIGRSEHNDLPIDHEYISRQHAVLVRIGNATVILDLKSRNETYVNGKSIDNQVLINNDIISIGDHRIKFVDLAVTQRASTPNEVDDATTVAKSLDKAAARRLLRAVGD
ncbi:MAG: FHA domain-containing protein [Gammaproteobacteria bacterium]|nr:FHA domain-containing protein [Gammaproteobacteria bacterium]